MGYFLSAYHSDCHEQLEAIRLSILKNKIWANGENHQSDEVKLTPITLDGFFFQATHRRWGDLMAAVWSTHNNMDYSYMDFYYKNLPISKNSN